MKPWVLSRLRERQWAWMPDRVHVLRKGETSDDAGGSSAGYSRVETTSGRYRPGNREAREQILGERLSAEVAYVASLPYGTDIRLGDRLEFEDGQVLEVAATLAGSWSTAARVLCTAVL